MAESGLSPSLLLAMPQLEDPNFRRSVVLLLQHDDDGTFGLVLNRPVELLAMSLCSSLDVEWKGDPGASIHWGGPVQPSTGWVLFGDSARLEPDESVTEVASGLSFGGSLSILRSVADAPPLDARLFLGYSGWGPGQLESELAEGAWLLAPLSVDLIFRASSESMWDQVVRRLGIDPATLVSTRGVH